MKHTHILGYLMALVLMLTACQSGGSSVPDDTSSQPLLQGGTSAVPSPQPPVSSQEEQTTPTTETPPPPQESDSLIDVVLYIGTEGQFTEYPAIYHGEPDSLGMIPPSEVLSCMATLTGWNLDLADEITTGKGGITVCFADTSALFVGPPEPQKQDFHVYDQYQLDQTILDSVKKTLQCWAVNPELGDPDQVDIWFCGPDGGDLVLADLGITIPCTTPYQSFPTEILPPDSTSDAQLPPEEAPLPSDDSTPSSQSLPQ